MAVGGIAAAGLHTVYQHVIVRIPVIGIETEGQLHIVPQTIAIGVRIVEIRSHRHLVRVGYTVTVIIDVAVTITVSATSLGRTAAGTAGITAAVSAAPGPVIGKIPGPRIIRIQHAVAIGVRIVRVGGDIHGLSRITVYTRLTEILRIIVVRRLYLRV